MTAGIEFAEFIDRTLQSYATSASFRAALHNEKPAAQHRPVTGVCPPWHDHAATGTCYGNHKCRCDPCRAASSARQKKNRMRRAVRAWNTTERKATA